MAGATYFTDGSGAGCLPKAATSQWPEEGRSLRELWSRYRRSCPNGEGLSLPIPNVPTHGQRTSSVRPRQPRVFLRAWFLPRDSARGRGGSVKPGFGLSRAGEADRFGT